jgi:hypothetical protein
MIGKLLIVIALGLLCVVYAEDASACIGNAIPARITLLDGGALARIYLQGALDKFGFLVQGPANAYVETTNRMLILLMLLGLRYHWAVYFEVAEAAGCPEEGFIGTLTYAESPHRTGQQRGFDMPRPD